MQLAPLLIIPFALSTSACFWVTTKHEGKLMRQDIERIDTVVQKQDEAMGSSVKELEETLEKASKVLARNSADLGSQFDGLERENAKLNGLVMEAKRYAEEVKKELESYEERFTALERRLLELEQRPVPKPVVEKTPDQLWTEGMDAFKANNYSAARSIFKTLIIRHPTHPKAAEAQYHRGEAYYVQKDYKNALKEFQAVFERYGQSTRAPEALFRAGESAEKLKWCTDARAYYGLLRQKYPKSDKATKAKAKDASIKKRAKNKKYCES